MIAINASLSDDGLNNMMMIIYHTVIEAARVLVVKRVKRVNWMKRLN